MGTSIPKRDRVQFSIFINLAFDIIIHSFLIIFMLNYSHGIKSSRLGRYIKAIATQITTQEELNEVIK